MHTIKPNDYGYASSGCRNGEQTMNYYNNETCTSTNWLFVEYQQWLLNPAFNSNNLSRHIYSNGYVSDGRTGNSSGIRPTVYLKPEVKITSGEGTLENPYSLSL